MPLIITSGAGAETRMSIGVVVLGGVISATFFTLFIVPVAYSLIARNTGSPNAISEQLQDESKSTVNK
jgi:multidrug efflux pump